MISTSTNYIKEQIREIEKMLLPLSSRKPVNIETLTYSQLEEKYAELSDELDSEIYGGLY